MLRIKIIMSNNSDIVIFTHTGEEEVSSGSAELNKLAELLAKMAPYDGYFDLSVPCLRVIRSSKPMETSVHSLASPGVCIVAQGTKAAYISDNTFEYDESHMSVYAAEVPVTTRIVKASKEKPYLCLVVSFDAQKMAELIIKVFPAGLERTANTSPIYVGNSNPKILQSANRLMELLLQEEDSDLLAPLIIDEILIRLLRSPAGSSIAQIGLTDSYAQKIARAISWLKENYVEPVKVEDLAQIAGMSSSSFHQHFKDVTMMSPLQFQKALRLQEARNLMVSKKMDVSTACMQVGYSSISQFSREYTRHFGQPPKKDVSSIRESSKGVY